MNPGPTQNPVTVARVEFDSFAAEYEALHARSIRLTGEKPEYFAAYKASYIVRLLPSGPCHLLDYGCGIGTLSRHLKGKRVEIQVDGFDPSRESLAQIGPDLLNQGLFTSDPKSLSSRYDMIIIANVMHHVKPTQRQDLVAAVSARLASGGKLVVFEHNPANPLTRWAVRHCAFDGDAVLLWPDETARYMSHAGLRNNRDYIVFFPRWLAPLRRFEPKLRWCPLGAQYAVTGTKLS